MKPQIARKIISTILVFAFAVTNMPAYALAPGSRFAKKEATEDVVKRVSWLSAFMVAGDAPQSVVDKGSRELVSLLGHEDREVKKGVIATLSDLFHSQKRLPAEVIDDGSKEMVRLLSHPDDLIKQRATYAFSNLFEGRRKIGQKVIDARAEELAQLVADRDSLVASYGAISFKALIRSKRDIPQEIIDRVARASLDFIDDPDDLVKEQALLIFTELFKSLRQIPQEAVDNCSKKLAAMLSTDDMNITIRKEAAAALGALFASERDMPSSVAEDSSTTLVRLLDRQDSSARDAFKDALMVLYKSKRNISEAVIRDNARMLRYSLTNPFSRWEAARLLAALFVSERNITQDVVDSCSKRLEEFLNYSDERTPGLASIALGGLFTGNRQIPQDRMDKISRRLVGLLSTKDYAFFAPPGLGALFKSKLPIPSDVLEDGTRVLVGRLSDPNESTRNFALATINSLFEGQREIPQDVIDKRIKELLPSVSHPDDEVRRDILLAFGKFVGRSGTLSEEVKEALRDKVGLMSIAFTDGGNAPNTASAFGEGVLSTINDTKTLPPPDGVPQKRALSLDDIPVCSLDELIPKGYRFLRAQGRTLIYKGKDGRYLAVKLLKQREDPALLDYESQWFDYLNEKGEALDIKGEYPVSHKIKGHRVVRINGVSKAAEKALEGLTDKDGDPVEISKRYGSYTAMAYEVKDDGYFIYLSDSRLSQKRLAEAMATNLHDLFALARHGIVHTQLIELFHNVIQHGREDRGRYLWMIDIIRPMEGRTGAGRLHAWTQAVRYPNMRLSGIADFSDIYHISEIAKEENETAAHLDTFRAEHPDYKPEAFYLASYLGDYLSSATLVVGKHLRDKERLNWEKPGELADLMKRCFIIGFCAYTGRSEGEVGHLAETINWERHAMQMAVNMAKGDKLAPFLLSESISERMYGPDVMVTYSENYPSSRGWVDDPRKGIRGWYFDGQNPDLGPVNGSLPLQELIKANYIFTSLMIADRANSQRAVADASREIEARAAVREALLAPGSRFGRRALDLDEKTCRSLSSKIVEELNLKQVSDFPTYNDTEYTYGARHYVEEMWGAPIEEARWGVEPICKFYFIRIGSLFFIEETAYSRLSQPLREVLGANVIKVTDLDGNLGHPMMEGFIISTIIAMMNSDFLNKRTVDLGAGDGILSLVAMKLGASSVDLVEIDSKKLAQADRQLRLNGFIKDKHYRLHNTDLKETAKLADRLKLTKGETAVISNIGTWPGVYDVTNADSIALIREIPDVTLFVGGGYKEWRHQGFRFISVDQDLIKQLGFIINPIIAKCEDEIAALIAWSATSGQPLKLAPGSRLGKRPRLASFERLLLHRISP